jgi:fructose-1,6-bisphosphatase/inositol monophosphatase family enzyme
MRDVAEQAVLPRFRNLAAHEVQEKEPGDPVTIADREAEQLLGAGLTAICPDARVIGEEACAAEPALLAGARDGLVWIVDPIDGTANFSAGTPPFGIMIALLDDGDTQASWIYDPLSHRLCHAVRGGGAFVGGQQIRVVPPAGRPTAAVTAFGEPEAILEARRARIAAQFSLMPMPRCAAEQYPRVCLGQTDVAMFRRTLPWDHAAGALLVAEAGGRIARWNGTPYRAGDDGVGLLAAATPELWEAAAALLFTADER